MCNNEKLASGSTAVYVESCREFLASTVFKSDGGTPWPTAILAPSNMEKSNKSNLQTKVSRAQPLKFAECTVPTRTKPLAAGNGGNHSFRRTAKTNAHRCR